MEKKRTRAARHTACGRCKKAHRVCDGNRPCKRCFLRGKSSLCQTPPKQQSRRRPRKQKIGFLVDTDIKPPQGCLSVFDQFESVSATGCSHNHGILPESAMQQPVLLALLEQIRDLNDTTSALLITHHTMSVEVTDLKHKITDGYCQQFPKQLTPVASLPESCATNEEIQTLARIDHPTEDILLSASVVAIPKDTNRFLPFAIDDATTPFYILGMDLRDWEQYRCLKLLGRELKGVSQVLKCLTGNASFFSLTQYTESDLVNTSPLFCPPALPHREGMMFIEYMFPPAEREIHASAPLIAHPTLRTKEGAFLKTITKGQFFYCEGHVSFIVCNILSATLTHEPPTPDIVERASDPHFSSCLPSTCSEDDSAAWLPSLSCPSSPLMSGEGFWASFLEGTL